MWPSQTIDSLKPGYSLENRKTDEREVSSQGCNRVTAPPIFQSQRNPCITSAYPIIKVNFDVIHMKIVDDYCALYLTIILNQFAV